MTIRSINIFTISALWCSIASLNCHAESVEVVLRLKESVSMESLAKAVADPSSPRYQKYFTPEEIRAIAAPSDEEYDAIIKQLKANDIEIVSETPTHLMITVKGERSKLEAMDQNAKQPFQSLDFSPVSRNVISVNGLSPSPVRRPHIVLPDTNENNSKAGGTSPTTIRQLYGIDKIYSAGITGKGQHIAIATYNDFFIDDVNQYYAKNNIANPAPQVDKVVFNGTPSADMGSAAETETDAELSGMIAPGAIIHVFTSAQNSDAGELQMFTAILDDNRAKIVNYSWGYCESQLDPAHKTDMNNVFARAVAQGVNIFVASGDSGSDCMQDRSTVADHPANSPYVVSVGGTTLGSNNGEASESAWNGSGGGISTVYDLPSYQKTTLGSAYKNRAYPDIAFNANPSTGQPVWVRYNNFSQTIPANPSYMIIGGTSIAAPQWAGYLALVAEARGGKALGFLNPLLYAIPSTDRANYFHDITSGNNGAYSASTGWDAVTGFGSMRGFALFTYLKAL